MLRISAQDYLKQGQLQKLDDVALSDTNTEKTPTSSTQIITPDQTQETQNNPIETKEEGKQERQPQDVHHEHSKNVVHSMRESFTKKTPPPTFTGVNALLKLFGLPTKR